MGFIELERAMDVSKTWSYCCHSQTIPQVFLQALQHNGASIHVAVSGTAANIRSSGHCGPFVVMLGGCPEGGLVVLRIRSLM